MSQPEQQPLPKFEEEYIAKLPALTLMTNMGWSFLSPEQALAARGGKLDQVVLRDELHRVLKTRRFHYAGSDHPLSEKSIENIISEVCSPALNEGLRQANQRMHNHLLYGITVTEFVDGRKTSQTVELVDWKNIANNSFLVTEEFRVTRTGGIGSSHYDCRKPDIVGFVNGIPMVVIEAKRPVSQGKKGPTIEEGISQNLRNQMHDEIPHLFVYSQILLSINGNDGRYATCGTPLKFWGGWREEDITDAEMLAVKNRKLTAQQVSGLFSHRKPEDLHWYQNLISGGQLAVTGQDQMLISLLLPARLLEMTRLYTLFDTKVGRVIARYQQVFGIKRLTDRIKIKNAHGGREGGVIWHTTGSGKSLTMVLFSKALLLDESLKACRFIVVTDRVDLQSQLSKSFVSGGELAGKNDYKHAMATSGARLAQQIGQGKQRIIFSLIQKFTSATELPECHNDDANIVVLIDEGHRSQGGENHIRMKMALPNAAFVAFTGTPLLKDDKTTNKFGPIVHAYTMQRAVEDKAVTPLLYEERKPELNVNEKAVDSWFDRITLGLSDAQRADLKRKYSRKGAVQSADDRLRLIALDVANHFSKHITGGLKGQLACDSKLSAIKFKQYLDEAGLFESAVVMSPPDTREGNTAIDEATLPEVSKWWKDNVGSQDERKYTQKLITRFEKDENLKLLIVVDKLLTGFDEPLNTVLYIDKSLKGHNLIQAIARVNRLHDKKKEGLLIDYRGVLAELDTTIAKYQDLASRTQGGYDINDIDGLYHQMSSEYKRLPLLYRTLWAIFDGVVNKSDTEQLRQALVPKMEQRNGEFVDIHLKAREDFYEALSEFASCLKVALQSATFFEDNDFTDADRNHYKDTVRQLSQLRRQIKEDAGETVDYDEYAEQVKKLLDKHVVGVQIQEPEAVYDVSKMGRQKPKTPDTSWSEDKTRNETDIIKTRVTKMIEQELHDDPYAREKFSVLLLKTIEEAEKQFDHPAKQYLLYTEFMQDVENRRLQDIPDVFGSNKHAQAYYGVFKKTLPQVFASADQQVEKKWVELAFIVDTAVDRAVTENSINTQNIEAEIRKNLLTMLFHECKRVGAGINQVNIIVESVVQITRVGLSGV